MSHLNLYGEKYYDELREYRIVELKLDGIKIQIKKSSNSDDLIKIYKLLQDGQLLTEKEWKNLGIQMTSGWNHIYTLNYKEDPQLLFSRLKTK